MYLFVDFRLMLFDYAVLYSCFGSATGGYEFDLACAFIVPQISQSLTVRGPTTRLALLSYTLVQLSHLGCNLVQHHDLSCPG